MRIDIDNDKKRTTMCFLFRRNGRPLRAICFLGLPSSRVGTETSSRIPLPINDRNHIIQTTATTRYMITHTDSGGASYLSSYCFSFLFMETFMNGGRYLISKRSTRRGQLLAQSRAHTGVSIPPGILVPITRHAESPETVSATTRLSLVRSRLDMFSRTT